MCGRYVRFRQWADLKQLLPLLDAAAELPPSYNVAPTQKMLVARDHDGKLEGVVKDKKRRPISRTRCI